MNLTQRSIVLFVLLAFAGQNAVACLNEVRPVRTFGEYLDMDGPANEFMERFTSRGDRDGWVVEGSGGRRSPMTTSSAALQQSVLYVREGRVPEAIAILEKLEQDEPGMYETASNLGTAYELNGENEKALHWIREGIRRNPDSHFGTEWLHVKILEAKLALAKDPDWLKKNTVLGLDPNKKSLSSESHAVFDGAKINLDEIETALVYQLHERLFFVKPPDPTVADLLFDLERVFAVTRTSAHASEINKLAMSYDGQIAPIDLSPTPFRRMLPIYAGSAAALLAVIGVIAFFFNRKRQPESISFSD